VRVTSHSPVAFQPGIGSVEMQGLAVAAHLGGPGRVGVLATTRPSHFVTTPSAANTGGRPTSRPGRELGVSQVHGGLVGPAAGPTSGPAAGR